MNVCGACLSRDAMDSVKQSAALCLLRLNRTSPDLVPMGEWTTRVVHLLNDPHLVRLHFITTESPVAPFDLCAPETQLHMLM